MDTASVRTVASAMEDVAKWRAEAEGKASAELTEADQEIGSLTTAIANLQQQLEALQKFREELVVKQSSVNEGEGAKIYNGIFEALRSQAGALTERAKIMSSMQSARSAALAAVLNDPAVKQLNDEYAAFKTTIEPTLSAMPESFRDVIMAKHNEIEAQLKAKVAEADPGLPTIEGDTLTLDIVFGVDAPEGTAEIIMVVLPVPEETQAHWFNRADDLQTWLAARAVQAVYQACHSVGLPTAQAMFGGHQGLMAIELELGGGDPGPIQSALQTAFDQILGDSTELNASKVSARGYYALVDHLLPPEEEPVQQEMSNA